MNRFDKDRQYSSVECATVLGRHCPETLVTFGMALALNAETDNLKVGQDHMMDLFVQLDLLEIYDEDLGKLISMYQGSLGKIYTVILLTACGAITEQHLKNRISIEEPLEVDEILSAIPAEMAKILGI